MDTTKGRLGKSESEAASAPTLNQFVDPVSAELTRLNTIPTGVPNRSLGTNYTPLGTPGRHPSSPFPPETGKRTLETGPSYER